jgi:HEAT repeat protein
LREFQQQFHGGDRRWSQLVVKPSEINFQPYLQSILDDEDYREWQDLYTPTTVEDRKRSPQPKFSSRLKLRVETVKPPQENRSGTPEAEPNQQEQVEPWDVLAGLRNYASDHVLLIGKPGSGKSTSLERLLWEEASNALNTPNAKIPVLVKLRRCTSIIEELIRDFLNRHQLPLDVAEIEKLLRQGKFLLLLDGLNELPESFKTDIANFRDRYRRTTPMIFSTRELSVGGNLGITKTLKMLPLTELQMQEFVQGYLGEEGNRLFQQLKGDRLRKFAETPLLLWMLCRVFAQNGQVPANLGLAFREFTQLHEQDIQADAPADSRDKWSKLLRHLAFALMHDKQPTDFRLSMPREEAENLLTDCLQQEGRANSRDCAERWLKDLLKYHLIQSVIQPTFEEHIEFRHQLIQEYYAAEYLLRILPELSDEQLKRDHLNYLKWREPVALMLVLVDKEAQAVQVVQLALDVDWMLGARLAGEVKREFQAQTVGMVEALEVPDWLKGKLLKQVQSTTSLSESESDYSWEKRVQERMKPELISDEKIIELCLLIENESRWMAASEFHRLTDWGASGESRILVGQKAIPRLLNLLNHIDPDVRWCVAHILLIIGDRSATQGLCRLLKDPSDDVRKSAVVALGKICDETAIPDLIEFLKNPSHNVDRSHELRQCGSSALASIGGKQALIGLLSLLEHPDEDVRWCAIDGLGEMGDKDAAIGLIYRLRDCSSNIRSQAAYTLGFIADETVVPELISYLQCVSETSDEECWSVIDALGGIGSKKAIPELHRFLAKSKGYLKETAIFALGKIGDESVIPYLIDILQTSSLDSKGTAIKILGKMQAEPAIPYFLDILENDPYVRSRNDIAGILGGFQKERAAHMLPDLLALLSTESGEHAFRAMQGIQANCKFYNYDIWQEAIQNEKLEIKNGEQETAVGQTTTIFNIETLNAPNAALNLGGTIHGDQSGTQNHKPNP